jgi:hypothetical protein
LGNCAMHIAGKLLILLTLGLSLGAFYMGAKLIDRRGKWLKDVEQAKQEDAAAADALAKAQLDHKTASGDLEREMLRWDHYWSEIPGGYVAQQNMLIANAGTADGVEPNSIVHAFQLGPKGVPSYVGPFTVAEVQAKQASLKPAFRVREEDLAKWQANSWRFRTMIPSSFTSRITDLETQLVKADELLTKQNGNLESQKKLIDEAKHQHDDRIGELLGNKANAAQPGLVADIARAEDQRNASLAEVDRLRREIRTTLQHVEQLIQENNNLARTLPGVSAPKETALAPASR